MKREDLISRQAVLKSIFDDDTEYTGSEICNMVRNLPSFKPQEPCDDVISREDAFMCMTGEYLADKDYTIEEIISKHIKRIKALPSVTPKTCEDCISRAWLKGAIHNFYYGLKHTPTEEDIQAYIDAAQSVTPMQRTGESGVIAVIDKIRAEIKQLPYQRIFGNVSNYSLIDTVIEIIDKYKEESEERNER